MREFSENSETHRSNQTLFQQHQTATDLFEATLSSDPNLGNAMETCYLYQLPSTFVASTMQRVSATSSRSLSCAGAAGWVARLRARFTRQASFAIKCLCRGRDFREQPCRRPSMVRASAVNSRSRETILAGIRTLSLARSFAQKLPVERWRQSLLAIYIHSTNGWLTAWHTARLTNSEPDAHNILSTFVIRLLLIENKRSFVGTIEHLLTIRTPRFSLKCPPAIFPSSFGPSGSTEIGEEVFICFGGIPLNELNCTRRFRGGLPG